MRAAIFVIAAVFAFAATALASSDSMTTGGMMIIHHKVADYAKWRPVYDADKPNRDAGTLSNCRVTRATDNAKDIVILCDVADMAKAKAYATSAKLKDTMKRAGVKGKPEILYLTPAP